MEQVWATRQNPPSAKKSTLSRTPQNSHSTSGTTTNGFLLLSYSLTLLLSYSYSLQVPLTPSCSSPLCVTVLVAGARVQRALSVVACPLLFVTGT